MKHYLNVCDMNGGEIPSVDVVTFGSPCQDLSIAGKRAGLKHEENGDDETTRSGLFMEAIRIIKEMRKKTNGKYPTFAVWENVPSALSSNKGEDFRTVLTEMCRIKDETANVPMPKKWGGTGFIVGNGYSVAWRVLDAQYYGVPQRRRRIFLVADFDGGSAGEILFKPESVSGNSPQGFRSWQGTSGSAEESVGTSSLCLNDHGGQRMDITEGFTATLRAASNHPPLVFENHSQDSRYRDPLDIAQTVLSAYGTGGNNQPFVLETPKTLKIRSGCEGGGKGALVQDNLSATLACNNDQTVFVPKCYGICSKDSNSMKSDNPHSGFYEAETSRCLDANGGNPSCNQGGMAVVAVQGSMIGRAEKNGPQGSGIGEDVSFTLNTADRHAVAFSQEAYDKYVENNIGSSLRASGGMYGGGSETLVYSTSKNSYHTEAEENLANTLVATDYKGPPTVAEEPQYIIRRLTPTECARLQGFPDWWAEINVKEDFTDEEYKFWHAVRNTHAEINGKTVKEYTKPQMVKWYNKLHTDTAEYKMWGNGVALPCVRFVLSRIAKHGTKTLGSLFDGSGGFPIAGCLCGITPIWASEIEPYPIAVTASRFGIDTE